MTDFQSQLAALREAFTADLPGRLDDLGRAWTQDATEGTATRTHHQAHQLAGSAGTFGFSALAQEAGNLERILKEAAEHGRSPGDEEAKRVLASLAELRRLLPSPPAASSSTGPSTHLKVGFSPAGREDEALARQLESLGYDVTPAEGGSPCDALLLDAEAPTPEGAAGLPRIFLSDRGDMASRIRALRAGGQAYFARPVNTPALVDRLDALCARQPLDPYRVLVVDDDPAMAQFIALTLQTAGMVARHLSDPLAILESLFELRPDVLLLDMHMPDCSGDEVAAVLRQMEPLAGLPIMFLSGEQNFTRQMDAMGQGADDFLTKPIAPERLVARVTHRAWRGRLLQGRMTRDGLTGLLNHSALLDNLDAEVARARRLEQPLAFAMADLDHFKRVNDAHGHGMGDQVLRAFARLLQQRLRRSDSLGRYGGEEFGIVLPDTEALKAHALLEALRQDFAALEFQGATGIFHATFSAGLAVWPIFPNAAALCEAADQALYQAKAGGRNRVETASTC